MMGRSNILLAALAVSLLAGCSTLYRRVDAGADFEEADFEAGATSHHEVLDALGPPNRMSKTGEGFAFLYESMLIRELQTGLAGRDGIWQLIKFSFADSKLFRDTLTLRFDHEGVLLAQAKSQTREGLGKSGAIQPLLTVQQIVDTSAYDDDATESLEWGMEQLKPLPTTLNEAQSLNSGAAGFEQGGTSSKVGQHALEMR